MTVFCNINIVQMPILEALHMQNMWWEKRQSSLLSQSSCAHITVWQMVSVCIQCCFTLQVLATLRSMPMICLKCTSDKIVQIKLELFFSTLVPDLKVILPRSDRLIDQSINTLFIANVDSQYWQVHKLMSVIPQKINCTNDYITRWGKWENLIN